MRHIPARLLLALLTVVLLVSGGPATDQAAHAAPPHSAYLPVVASGAPAPALQTTPLAESFRLKLINHFVGDVRAWKADDAGETIIFGAKDPARDPNNTSFYALSRAGVLTYLGTTALGKDGGVQPIVRNDGTIDLLLTEAPVAGASGSLADLYLVRLQYTLPAEPAPASSAADAYARAKLAAIHAATAP
jgi:hypothetical protein